MAALLASAALSVAATTAAAAVIIGSTEVALDARYSTVRYVEANVGNLTADAIRWQTSQSGFSPTIGFINGGAIRPNVIHFPSATPATPADVTDDDTLTILPFDDHVGLVANVTVADLLLALEHAVAVAAPGDPFSIPGRFLQVSGLRFSWDTTAVAGSRIIDVILDDATPLVDDGTIVSSMLLNIATVDFLAVGGDGFTMLTSYPFAPAGAGPGTLYSDALANYIQNYLGGQILATDYPVGGEGRILQNAQLIPEPGTLALLGLGFAGLAASRRRKK